MILNLITLANVKIHLGIASGNTLYDTQITAMIPVVSSDVRRILNCNFDNYVMAQYNTASKNILFGDNYITGEYVPLFDLGQVIYSPGIPENTYLESFNPLTGYYTLSATPTAVGTYAYPTIRLSQFPTISKMIWYRIQGMSTDDASKKGIQSESYGPVSITYSQKEINSQYNYPQILIDDLGTPFAKVG